MIMHILKLLINLSGRYARVVDNLAVRNVAQGAPLGGGSTLRPIRDKAISKTMDARISQKYQTVQEERQFQNFDCALGMIAWEHISTELESVPTPTARCAASTKPWTETI